MRGKEVRVAPFMKGVRVGIIQGYENCNTRRGIYIVCVKCVQGITYLVRQGGVFRIGSNCA